jgi:hypothetical protein
MTSDDDYNDEDDDTEPGILNKDVFILFDDQGRDNELWYRCT